MPSGPNGRAPLTVKAILAWADAHKARTGAWPTQGTTDNTSLPRCTWSMINAALRVGRRGLPGGDSLAQLLARKRGVHNRKGQPKLTEDQILHWARAYRKRTGTWPRITSGPIEEAPGGSGCRRTGVLDITGLR
jgi:hypothetical protein